MRLPSPKDLRRQATRRGARRISHGGVDCSESCAGGAGFDASQCVVRKADEIDRMTAVVGDLDERRCGARFDDRSDGSRGPAARLRQGFDDLKRRPRPCASGDATARCRESSSAATCYIRRHVEAAILDAEQR
jgi:hypothetical protein